MEILAYVSVLLAIRASQGKLGWIGVNRDASAWAIHSRSRSRRSFSTRFAVNRRRTRALFDLLDESVYYERPISLRNPVVFYEGHVPAFSVNTLIKKALGRPGVDEHLETIFARGIDPESEATSVARGNPAWPSRAEVRQYVERRGPSDREGDLVRRSRARLAIRCCDQARALWTILEHEEMHQETLGYIWHQVPYSLQAQAERLSRRVTPSDCPERTCRLARVFPAASPRSAPTFARARSPGTTSVPRTACT